MADRLTTGMTRLAARLASRAGVSAVYARGAVSVTLTAVRLSDDRSLSQPGQPPLRLANQDADWSLSFAELDAAGLFPPRPGDTLTVAAVAFELMTRPGDSRPVWEWGEAERLTARVRASQRVRVPGPAVPAGGVAWAGGDQAQWAGGDGMVWA